MSIRLAAQVAKKLFKRELPLLRSTLLTDKGPKAGTIWFDRSKSVARDSDKRTLLVVKYVDAKNVRYESGDCVHLDAFLADAHSGQLVLVGMTSPPQSLVEV